MRLVSRELELDGRRSTSREGSDKIKPNAGSGEREDWSLHAPRSAHASPCADYTVTPPLRRTSTSHQKRGAYFTALVHHRHGRRSRLVRGWIPREPREPLLERLVRNPRGRRRGELALLRAALRGEPPHLRRGDAQGERSGPGSEDEARRRTSVPSEGGALLPSSSARAHTRGHSAESCSPGGSARISPADSMPGEG